MACTQAAEQTTEAIPRLHGTKHDKEVKQAQAGHMM
jgi:hypothetical protein